MVHLLSIVQGVAVRVLVFGVLVFIHELGHYLAARWRGIYVEAFSIGFGPALVSWTDRHGTVWKIGLLPLGGFVKMHGMALNVANETAMDDTVTRPGQGYNEKPVFSRAIVAAAGPVANFLLAMVLLSVLFCAVGRQVPLAVVGEVAEASSAATAGLKPGDRIETVDGEKITAFETLRRIVAASAGQTLTMQVARGAQLLSLPVEIKPAEPGDMSVGRLGISSGASMTERLWPGAALVAGVAETGHMFGAIFGGLVHIVTTGHGLRELGGPIAVVVMSGQAAAQGLPVLIWFVAFLSVNLGLVNLLPIPILDGGHLMFYAAEAVRGRPLPASALDYGYRAGFALIACMFVFISFNDLVHTGALRWVAHLIG
jgi:regulator of sigma E protease